MKSTSRSSVKGEDRRSGMVSLRRKGIKLSSKSLRGFSDDKKKKKEWMYWRNTKWLLGSTKYSLNVGGHKYKVNHITMGRVFLQVHSVLLRNWWRVEHNQDCDFIKGSKRGAKVKGICNSQTAFSSTGVQWVGVAGRMEKEYTEFDEGQWNAVGSPFRPNRNRILKWDPYLNQHLEILVEALVELDQKKEHWKARMKSARLGCLEVSLWGSCRDWLMMPAWRVGPWA